MAKGTATILRSAASTRHSCDALFLLPQCPYRKVFFMNMSSYRPEMDVVPRPTAHHLCKGRTRALSCRRWHTRETSVPSCPS